MIYKRNNTWHMYACLNGVRYRESLHTTDRREASRLEKKRVGEIQQGKGASRSNRSFARKPFSEAADEYLEDRKASTAERTQQLERERLKPLRAFFKSKSLLRIRAEDIAAYQRTRRGVVQSRTLNMELGVLRQMMTRAKTWNLVREDVTFDKEKPGSIGRVLTPEQKRHLFRTAASRSEWQVAYLAAVIAVSTTCRGVELKHLQWQDVDLFARAVTIRRSKTDAGLRVISLNDDAMAALTRLRARADLHNATDPEHYIFPTCENEHIDPTRPQKTWRTAWRALLREAARQAGRAAANKALHAGAGLGRAKEIYRRAAAPFRGFRFHDLRHQAITELAEHGEPDATIKAIAGHINQAMLDHYSHARLAAKKLATDALSSNLIQASEDEDTALTEAIQ